MLFFREVLLANEFVRLPFVCFSWFVLLLTVDSCFDGFRHANFQKLFIEPENSAAPILSVVPLPVFNRNPTTYVYTCGVLQSRFRFEDTHLKEFVSVPIAID